MKIEVKQTANHDNRKMVPVLKELNKIEIISYRVWVTEDNILYSGFDRAIAQAMYDELNKAAGPEDLKPKHEYKRVAVKDIPRSEGFAEIVDMMPPIIKDLLLRQVTHAPATMSDIEDAHKQFPSYFTLAVSE
jgi:hypothetical protein